MNVAPAVPLVSHIPKRGLFQSLRTRTLIQSGVILAGMILVLLLPLRTIFLESFLEFEQQSMLVDVARVQNALTIRQDDLGKDAVSWSAWDEVYEYMVMPDPAFIEANIPPETFSDYNFDLIMYIQPSGAVTFAQYAPPELGAQVVPPDLLTKLAANPQLFQLTGPNDRHDGIVAVPQGFMLLSIRPILTDTLQGPVRGAAVLGRLLIPVCSQPYEIPHPE